MNKLVISMFGAMIFATRRLPKLRSLPPRRRHPKSTRSTILAPPSKAKSLVEKAGYKNIRDLNLDNQEVARAREQGRQSRWVVPLPLRAM